MYRFDCAKGLRDGNVQGYNTHSGHVPLSACLRSALWFDGVFSGYNICAFIITVVVLIASVFTSISDLLPRRPFEINLPLAQVRFIYYMNCVSMYSLDIVQECSDANEADYQQACKDLVDNTFAKPLSLALWDFCHDIKRADTDLDKFTQARKALLRTLSSPDLRLDKFAPHDWAQVDRLMLLHNSARRALVSWEEACSVEKVEKHQVPVRVQQPEPVREQQPEPVREQQPEPVREQQPEPVREQQLEPVREQQPEPIRDHAPVPMGWGWW
jgi:hypothetical protein